MPGLSTQLESLSMSLPPPPSPHLLELPAEIRNQIYALAIPVTRLCKRRHCLANPMVRHYCAHCADRLDHDSPRTASSLLFVCRSTHKDCFPIFYSRAVLEIAPIRLPGHNLTSDLPSSADEDYFFLARGLETEYAFLPDDAKKLIHTAYIWTHDGNGITTDTFTALVRWIVRNLNPHEIHVSKPVTEYLNLRHRHTRVGAPQQPPWQLGGGQPPMWRSHAVRTIRAICDQEIWATHASLQPESGKVELAPCSATRRIPCVKIGEKQRP